MLLISTALSIVVFLVVYIYTIISEIILIKKLVHISNTASYEEFFEEYDKEQKRFLIWDYNNLIESYKEFALIIEHMDSLVKIEVCDSSLWMTLSAENGDIETMLIDIDKIVQNINIKEPEIRVGYDYKITYLEPYIS